MEVVNKYILMQKFEAKHFLDDTNVTVEPLVSEDQINMLDIDHIAHICNETNIYNLLFNDISKGVPFTEQTSKKWIKYAEQGWRNNEYFSYIIRQNSRIVGGIEIKSNNADFGEIIYWISNNTKGFMTNVIYLLCKRAQLAGYRTLAAFVEVNNLNAKRVLDRVGFSTMKIQSIEGKQFYRMELKKALI